MSDTKASPLPGVVAWAVEMAPHMERTTGPLSNHDAKRLARAVIALHEENGRAEQRTAEAIAAWLCDLESGLQTSRDAHMWFVVRVSENRRMRLHEAIRSGAWRPTPAPPSREEKP